MHHLWVTLTLALTSDRFKNLLSEYGDVAYQIKGNEIYNNQAKISPLHAPLTPEWGQRSKQFSFRKVVMLHIKLNRMKHTITCNQIFCPYTHP